MCRAYDEVSLIGLWKVENVMSWKWMSLLSIASWGLYGDQELPLLTISRAWERSKYPFYWINIVFAPLWEKKIIKSGTTGLERWSSGQEQFLHKPMTPQSPPQVHKGLGVATGTCKVSSAGGLLELAARLDSDSVRFPRVKGVRQKLTHVPIKKCANTTHTDMCMCTQREIEKEFWGLLLLDMITESTN